MHEISYFSSGPRSSNKCSSGTAIPSHSGPVLLFSSPEKQKGFFLPFYSQKNPRDKKGIVEQM